MKYSAFCSGKFIGTFNFDEPVFVGDLITDQNTVWSVKKINRKKRELIVTAISRSK